MTAVALLHDLQARERRLPATGDRLTAVGHWARRRLDALPRAAVVAQIAALEAGERLALARHGRPRRELGQRVREQ